MVGAAATLVPVLWLGLVLANIFTDEIDDAALRNGELQSVSIVESAIEPFLEPKPLRAARRAPRAAGRRARCVGCHQPGRCLVVDGGRGRRQRRRR